MTGLLDLASLDSSGRVEPDGAEAEHLNSLFRPRPETLEKIRQFEEAFAIAAFNCRTMLVD
jgi:hypothetical protein